MPDNPDMIPIIGVSVQTQFLEIGWFWDLAFPKNIARAAMIKHEANIKLYVLDSKRYIPDTIEKGKLRSKRYFVLFQFISPDLENWNELMAVTTALQTKAEISIEEVESPLPLRTAR